MDCVLTKEGFSEAALSVKICNNAIIRRFNKQYLSHDYSTDVLAFPFLEKPLDGEKLYLGDCLVSLDMAFDRAKEFHCLPEEELSLYIIHGTLHLLGYRDKEPDDCKIMNQKQETYMGFWSQNLKKEKLIDNE